jgi:hypothetical protein
MGESAMGALLLSWNQLFVLLGVFVVFAVASLQRQRTIADEHLRQADRAVALLAEIRDRLPPPSHS